MHAMSAYYRSKLPAFYALEMRDWELRRARTGEDARPETKSLTYWARIVAKDTCAARSKRRRTSLSTNLS